MQPNKPNPRRKILILTASPKGAPSLRLLNEHRIIKDSLKQSDRRDEFEIQIESAVTISHIRRALLEHKPEIVIFCGHGAGTDGIVCEDEFGQIKLIPTLALSNLFKLVRTHVKCIVLNACFTEIQANEIVKHIEFVVAMKHSIGDEAALRFIEGFSDALFAGKEFVDCYKWGVTNIQLHNIPEDFTPVRKMKEDMEKVIKQPVKVILNQLPRTQYPLLKQMPKRSFLTLLIAVFSYILLISTPISTGTRRKEIAGSYIQESDPKNIDQDGDTSQHLRWYELRTTLNISFNYKERQWQAIETTFWKIYYAPDLSNLEKQYFIGISIADVKHIEQGTGGDRIKMIGSPTERQYRLKPETLLGEQKLIDKITETVNKEADFIKNRYREVLTEWFMDENGTLIKEKHYRQGGPVIKEKFRRF